MIKEEFDIESKKATLYLSEKEHSPLVVMNNFSGDGESVLKGLFDMGHRDINLLCVWELAWDHDMTPWPAPPLSSADKAYTGGADKYLQLLCSKILPGARERIKGEPAFAAITGYSLAGLFALYAMYKCDAFERAAAMSGSLWFPGFKEYCLEHEMKRVPEKLYLSLGDREALTKNPTLKSVLENTEALVAHYKELGLNVTWELNPGNHFKNVSQRCAKGIAALL